MKLSVVMDTNVLVSGVLWRGVPFQLLRWAEKSILTIYISLDILEEVHRVLHYPKLRQYIDLKKTSPDELFAKIESLCKIIQVEQQVDGVCSDPDDDKFISCALSASVDILISGDEHLLGLEEYHSIRIVTAREFHQDNVKKIGSHE